MLSVAGTVSTVTVATLLSRKLVGESTPAAIGIGFVVGYGCVLGLQMKSVQRRVDWPRRKRLLFGWFGVVALAVVGVGVLARTYLVVLGVQPVIASLGAAMTVYNASQSAQNS